MIRILELAWLTIAALSAATSIFQFVTEDIESALWMLFVAAVATTMFYVRRRQRIKFSGKDEKEHYH